jgi:hypothetical protein
MTRPAREQYEHQRVENACPQPLHDPEADQAAHVPGERAGK